MGSPGCTANRYRQSSLPSVPVVSAPAIPESMTALDEFSDALERISLYLAELDDTSPPPIPVWANPIHPRVASSKDLVQHLRRAIPAMSTVHHDHRAKLNSVHDMIRDMSECLTVLVRAEQD